MASASPSLREDVYAHTKLVCSKTHSENSQFEAYSHKSQKRNKHFKVVYMKVSLVSTASKILEVNPPLVAKRCPVVDDNDPNRKMVRFNREVETQGPNWELG